MKQLTPNQLLEIEPVVIEELIKARGKNPVKEVSNKLKLDQDLVRHIYNSRKVGQKRTKDQLLEIDPEPLTAASISTSLSYDEQATNEEANETLVKMSELLETPPISQSEEPVEEEVVPMKKTGWYISDEIKLSIMMDYEEAVLNRKEIADKYGISLSSVNRIIAYFNKDKRSGSMRKRSSTKKKSSTKSRAKRAKSGGSLNNHQRKKVVAKSYSEYVEEKVEETFTEVATTEVQMPKEFDSIAHEDLCNSKFFSEFKTLNNEDAVVRVGLCKDRHNMAVTKFIYNTLSDTEMFDYKYLYDKVLGFINCNCKKPDGTYRSIHLYCTGIQCALASVIKACYDMKVNLALYHYSANKNSYMRQDMWNFYDDKFNHTQSEVFADLTNKGPVYTYGDFDPLTSELYLISINQNLDSGDGFYSSAYVITSNLADGFKLYADYVEYIHKLRDDKCRRSVFLTKGKIQNRKFYWDINVSKSFNFK